MNNLSMKSILSSKDLIRQGLIGIIVMGVMFFSGFIAFGTYVIGYQQDSFVNSAVSVDGKIIDMKVHRREEKNTSSNGRTSSRVYNDSILVFDFIDQKGSAVQARLNDGAKSMYSVGDITTILYDPKNPKKIMLTEKRDQGQILEKISTIAFTVFIISFLVFILFGKRKIKIKKRL